MMLLVSAPYSLRSAYRHVFLHPFYRLLASFLVESTRFQKLIVINRPLPSSDDSQIEFGFCMLAANYLSHDNQST